MTRGPDIAFLETSSTITINVLLPILISYTTNRLSPPPVSKQISTLSSPTLHQLRETVRTARLIAILILDDDEIARGTRIDDDREEVVGPRIISTI